MKHTTPDPSQQEAIHIGHTAPTSETPGDVAAGFLKQLDPSGVHNLVALDPAQQRAPKGKTFRAGDFAAIKAWVDARAGDVNLYYTLNEVSADCADKKPRKSDIRRIRALCVDVDPRTGVNLDTVRAEIRKHLANYRNPQFTFIVDSGGGYQALLVLNTKIAANAEHIEWAESHARGLIQEMHGPNYQSDEVQNIDRLLRLPGPDNIPTPGKLAKGRQRRPARVVCQRSARSSVAEISKSIQPLVADVEPDRDDEIQAAISAIEHSGYNCVETYSELPDALRAQFDRDLAERPSLMALWREGKLASDDKSGSAYRAALSGALKRIGGYTEEDYAHLAFVWDRAVQAGDDRDSKLTPRALGRDWVNIPGEREAEDFFTKLTNSTGAASGWSEPVDIFSDTPLTQLSALPENALPPELTRWVDSESRRKGVSPAFAAAAAIATIAGSVGGGLKLLPRLRDTEWRVPCSLWVALVDNPGGGKSPIINAALKPLRELDAMRWAAAKPAVTQWEADNRGRKKSGTPKPTVPRTLVDDVTMEKLVSLSAENPRGLMQAPDELTQAFGQFGAYKSNGGGGDRSQYLRFYDGGPIYVDRVGAGARRTESALMGILAGTQPDRIGKLARDLGEDGMLQRFLFVVGDDLDRAGGEDAEPDAEALRQYRELVHFLAQQDFGSTELRMSESAFREFERARLAIRDLAHVPSASVAWQGHVAKWGATLARLVLTLHAVEMWRCHRALGFVETSCPVDERTVVRAAVLGKFLLRHAWAFYSQHFDPEPTGKETKSFAGYLLARPEIVEFSRRDAGQAQKSLRDTRKLASVMRALETLGWVRAKARDAEGPSRWEVNPELASRFSERAHWEAEDRARKRAAILRAAKARKDLLGQQCGSIESTEV
ncbi:DUF3987 domain-containing protein [Pacificitalea manganoxidans]|nr:DUF3987 domain-containing protein [Pacificitalea manganoxidans]MDR6308236.1 hypothetical protein [Pacificitalea manganoxidans]